MTTAAAPSETRSHSVQPSREAISKTDVPKLTIAVVDDDPSILRALDRFIRSRGCLAKVFASSPEFLEFAKSALPDCLILDVQMPVMSGLELYHQLLEQGHGLPVIFITAHEDANTESLARQSGAAGFFYKPFHNDLLWAAITNALPSHLRPVNAQPQIRHWAQ